LLPIGHKEEVIRDVDLGGRRCSRILTGLALHLGHGRGRVVVLLAESILI